MAVTKRTRFEVFRRDDHTCQYCGGKAPDVTLTIDHVMPVALGGDDKPGNLVTACKDCNAGKSFITPDSPLVSGLSDRAAAYALGMVDKMTRFRADIESFEDYEWIFLEEWNRWQRGHGDDRRPNSLPTDYKMSLFEWKQMGVPVSVFQLIVPVAMDKSNRDRSMPEDKIFRYMAGVLNVMMGKREIDLSVTDATAAVYTESDMEEHSQEEWSRGVDIGAKRALRKATALDPLRNHVDKTRPQLAGSEGHEFANGKVVHCGERSRPGTDRHLERS